MRAPQRAEKAQLLSRHDSREGGRVCLWEHSTARALHPTPPRVHSTRDALHPSPARVYSIRGFHFADACTGALDACTGALDVRCCALDACRMHSTHAKTPMESEPGDEKAASRALALGKSTQKPPKVPPTPRGLLRGVELVPALFEFLVSVRLLFVVWN